MGRGHTAIASCPAQLDLRGPVPLSVPQGALTAGGWSERSAGGMWHGPGTAAATVPEGEGLGRTGTEGAAWSAETNYKEK